VGGAGAQLQGVHLTGKEASVGERVLSAFLPASQLAFFPEQMTGPAADGKCHVSA
jgi:hypothetical protein